MVSRKAGCRLTETKEVSESMEVFDPGDQNCNSLEFVPDSLEYMDPTGCATE